MVWRINLKYMLMFGCVCAGVGAGRKHLEETHIDVET